ncbi:toprim domain-containing protein [Vibrio barjaei]|uniref:toprim domain-containing protein n=1 Tax=Vibrio barjaei TaxID=1676683 RepID=UPI00228356D2|nr:toprim domain-containing protein [Vibrio barjaei]MCY9872285.1 toprim domain-containing protein [Vibrio barjaei]
MTRNINDDRTEVDQLAASYGWVNIFSQLTDMGESASNYVDGRKTQNAGATVYCPGCESNSKKWSLLKDAQTRGAGGCWSCGVFFQYDVLMFWNNWTFQEAYKAVRNLVKQNGNASKLVIHRQPKGPTEYDLKRWKQQREKMYNCWGEGYAVSDPIAKPLVDYMIGRKITQIPSCSNQIRYHDNLPYWVSIPKLSEIKVNLEQSEEELNRLLDAIESSEHFRGYLFDKKTDEPYMADMGSHPAILKCIRDKNFNFRRIHRTYLSRQGSKILLPEHEMLGAKKMFSADGETESITGSMLFLDEVSEIMGAAEGFETASICRQFTGLPMISTINSGGMAGLDLPPGVKRLFVFEDKDRSLAGALASKRLMERYEGTDVEIIRIKVPFEIPEGEKGIDWLNVFSLPNPEKYIPNLY